MLARRSAAASQSHSRAIARSMGATPSALPALAAAVARLNSLGCHPPSVLKFLASGGVFAGVSCPRAIDLGCGRGELAVAMAAAFGAEVLGLDLHTEFLNYARKLERVRAAATPGAAGKCRFQKADATQSPRNRSPARRARDRAKAGGAGQGGYQLAVMLNVLPFDRAAPLARQHVAPGGYYLIDDALAKPGSVKALQTGVPPLSEVRAYMSSLGDKLVGTKSLARVVRSEMPARLAQLASGISDAGIQWPKCRPALAAMLQSHQHAATLMGTLLHPTLLLVRRGPSI